jgi:YfiR/HmsC-like
VKGIGHPEQIRHHAPRERLEWPAFSRCFAQSTSSPWLVLLLVVLHVLASAVTSFSADAETLTEYEIKAGFFFNFTRFVEWPEDAFATPTSPIVACVMGETPLTDPLAEVIQGKVVNGRAVSINLVKPSDDLRRCNLLFISEGAARRTGEILARLRKANTLTVGETPGFPLAGGMINFAILDNKVKLEINLDATTHAGLKVNSKLIAVSRLVSSNSVAEDN